ncbi:MAG: ABC transporter substrate-binding protein [Acidimicrobiales bacterium]
MTRNNHYEAEQLPPVEGQDGYLGKVVDRRALLRSLALGGLSLGSLPLLSACGGSSAPTHKSSPATSAAPRSGGTLNIGVSEDVVTFNPDNNLFNNFIYTRNIYDAMIDYTSNLTPIPRLATSWKMSPDNTSLTVNLRPGVVFQDGTPVTAQAIADNFTFAGNAATGFSLISIAALLKSVTVTGPTSLQLTFVTPTPLEKATDILQSLPIISPKSLTAAALKSTADGSGPFSFGTWTPGNELVLKRNPTFWDHGFPYLDSVVFHIFSNAQSMVAALSAGSLQAAVYVPPNLLSAVSSKHRVQKGHQGALTYSFHLNASKPPFNNKLVRQAMQLCFDREAIVRDVLFGYSAATVLPWGPESPAYDPSALTQYAFDLKKAKAMFDAAGVTKQTFACSCPAPYPEIASMAQILKADLNKIGLDITISTPDINTWVSSYYASNFQILPEFEGNLAKYPTYCTLNSGYRLKKNPNWGNGPLPASWVNALAAADSALTPSAQKSAFAAMNKSLLDEAWIIDVAYRQSLFVSSPAISGVGHNVDDMIELQDTRLT